MRSATTMTVLLLSLSCSACVGPRPEPPASASVQAPSTWRTQLGPGQPVSGTWWTAFGDPALSQLVEAALVANPDLQIAAARITEARALERLARAQLGPAVDASLGAAEARSVSAFGTGLTAFGAEPGVQISWEADLFGRLRNARAAARAQLLATEAARDAAALSVAGAVASGYIGLRALDARLVTLRSTLMDRADALRIARRRAETGYTSELELRQAEAEYRATEQLIPQAELAISRQEDALSLLTGRSPTAIARGLALGALTAPPIPDGLPADLLRRRPDLAEAQQSLVAADRTLDSARAAFLPRINLTGSLGLALSTALAQPITVWSLGGSVLAPIFESGRIQAQVEAGVSRRDQAAYNYRRVALTAFRDVEDSSAAVLRSGQQMVALAAQREALARALRNATNRYRAGYSAYIEQLDAERGLLSADLALIQARADRLTAYVGLYQAMGGGWSPRPG